MVFDLIFLTVFVWAAYRGFTNGFIIQIATFAALLLGIFGAIRFSGYINEILDAKTSVNSEYLPLVSFTVTFIIIVILVHLSARLFDKLLNAVALGFVNRLFGAIFSITKFALIISALLVILNNINSHTHFLPQDKIDQSKLYKPLSKLAPAIFPYLRFEKSKELIEDVENQIQV